MQGFSLDQQTIEEIEVIEKYEGYIVRQKREADNQRKLEEMMMPQDIDYLNNKQKEL